MAKLKSLKLRILGAKAREPQVELAPGTELTADEKVARTPARGEFFGNLEKVSKPDKPS